MNSMTGYGRGEMTYEDFKAEAEVKSVNQRFLDISFHLPNELNWLEGELREVIKGSFSRGRIDVYFSYQSEGKADSTIQLNENLLAALMEQTQAFGKERGQAVSSELLAALASQVPLVTIEKKTDLHFLHDLIMEAFGEALLNLALSRKKEGMKLAETLQQQATAFEAVLEAMKTQTEAIEADYEARVTNKITQRLEGAADKDRLLTEIALLIEKGDIKEELDRLNAHIARLGEITQIDGAIGREMDFLVQEMNREVNTIGAKSTNLLLKNQVVRMKVILEKIREQIQNIE
ncbi:MAG: YicC family protein [Enterococcaceae bacterium]|nr:YicC family protein [Enterococcaceae bacterium]MCI1919654.1 YicC family protein [Enterococcaceae bacterium]